MARTSEHRVTLYSLLLKTASNPKQRFCTATKNSAWPSNRLLRPFRRPTPCRKSYSQAPLCAEEISRTRRHRSRSNYLRPSCRTRSRYLPTESPESSVVHCSCQTVALRFFLSAFSLELLHLRLRERRHVRLPIVRR